MNELCVPEPDTDSASWKAFQRWALAAGLDLNDMDLWLPFWSCFLAGADAAVQNSI